MNSRATIASGFIFVFLANTFGSVPGVQAQSFVLPKPGTMVFLSPEFSPSILKGIKIHPDNPFRFDFILERGDRQGLQSKAPQGKSFSQNELKQEATKLIKYFFASLTVPEKDLWVNLSPYEKNRIIPPSFGLTEMGRDLLAEDYMLKQITASLIYPEDKVGKEFWQKVYAQAQSKYGTTNISINTFNKVWIVPEKAVVYENVKAGTAYVEESTLKVMLEQDYLSMSKHQRQPGDMALAVSPSTLPNGPSTEGESIPGKPRFDAPSISALGSQIVREVVIPELTKEVNEGKNFGPLRQVYNSLILATWYKKKIRDSILAQVYVNKNKVNGVQYTFTVIPAKTGIQFKNDVEGLYQEYLKAFKKGVFNYIKEEQDPMTQAVVPRKYFSGGVDWATIGEGPTNFRLSGVHGIEFTEKPNGLPKQDPDSAVIVTAQINTDFAMSHHGQPYKNITNRKRRELKRGHENGFEIGRSTTASAYQDPIPVPYGTDPKILSFLDRHYLQWEYLREKILPYLIDRALKRSQANSSRPRLVVADFGSGTGEEMARTFYEMVRALEEYGEGQDVRDWDIVIKGIDNNPSVIDQAKARIANRAPFFRIYNNRASQTRVKGGGFYADRIIRTLRWYPEEFKRSTEGNFIPKSVTEISPEELKDTDLVLFNNILRTFPTISGVRKGIFKDLVLKVPQAVIAIGESAKITDILYVEGLKYETPGLEAVEDAGKRDMRYFFVLPENEYEAIKEYQSSRAMAAQESEKNVTTQANTDFAMANYRRAERGRGGFQRVRLSAASIEEAYQDPIVLSSTADKKFMSFLDRHYLQWKYLREKILPYLIDRALRRSQANSSRPRLVIVDTGSSTGEEMARTFYEIVSALEYFRQDLDDWDIEIKGNEYYATVNDQAKARINNQAPFYSIYENNTQTRMEGGGYYADNIMKVLRNYPKKFKDSTLGFFIQRSFVHLAPEDLKDADLVLLNNVLRNFTINRDGLFKRLSDKTPHAVLAIGDRTDVMDIVNVRVKKHRFLTSRDINLSDPIGDIHYFFALPKGEYQSIKEFQPYMVARTVQEVSKAMLADIDPSKKYRVTLLGRSQDPNVRAFFELFKQESDEVSLPDIIENLVGLRELVSGPIKDKVTDELYRAIAVDMIRKEALSPEFKPFDFQLPVIKATDQRYREYQRMVKEIEKQNNTGNLYKIEELLGQFLEIFPGTREAFVRNQIEKIQVLEAQLEIKIKAEAAFRKTEWGISSGNEPKFMLNINGWETQAVAHEDIIQHIEFSANRGDFDKILEILSGLYQGIPQDLKPSIQPKIRREMDRLKVFAIQRALDHRDYRTLLDRLRRYWSKEPARYDAQQVLDWRRAFLRQLQTEAGRRLAIADILENAQLLALNEQEVLFLNIYQHLDLQGIGITFERLAEQLRPAGKSETRATRMREIYAIYRNRIRPLLDGIVPTEIKPQEVVDQEEHEALESLNRETIVKYITADTTWTKLVIEIVRLTGAPIIKVVIRLRSLGFYKGANNILVVPPGPQVSPESMVEKQPEKIKPQEGPTTPEEKLAALGVGDVEKLIQPGMAWIKLTQKVSEQTGVEEESAVEAKLGELGYLNVDGAVSDQEFEEIVRGLLNRKEVGGYIPDGGITWDSLVKTIASDVGIKQRNVARRLQELGLKKNGDDIVFWNDANKPKKTRQVPVVLEGGYTVYRLDDYHFFNTVQAEQYLTAICERIQGIVDHLEDLPTNQGENVPSYNQSKYPWLHRADIGDKKLFLRFFIKEKRVLIVGFNFVNEFKRGGGKGRGDGLGPEFEKVLDRIDPVKTLDQLQVKDRVAFTREEEIEDAAMVGRAELNHEREGGIDLTKTNMNLETRVMDSRLYVKGGRSLDLQGNGNAKGIEFHLDPAMLQQLRNASGFVPVVINIQPMHSLKEFLEL